MISLLAATALFGGSQTKDPGVQAQGPRPGGPKDLPDMEGVVEREFVYPLVLGEHVLPYRMLPPAQTVLPMTPSGRFVDANAYPGIGDWWARASASGMRTARAQ